MKAVMIYYGGKWKIADWIISHFPKHRFYVEPFAGAASILMKKKRSIYEYYNDLDSEVVNVFKVLRDPDMAQRLREMIILTPYSRHEFNQAYIPSVDPVDRARKTLIRSYMGFGSRGVHSSTSTGFRSTTIRGNTPPTKTWMLYPNSITAFTKRLQGVFIEHQPALSLIEKLDRKETLFYIDPPYVHSSRNIKNVYSHEMSDNDHVELLTLLNRSSGKIVISGYMNEIYSELLKEWTLHKKSQYIATNNGKDKRTEYLWLSPNIESVQRRLFR